MRHAVLGDPQSCLSISTCFDQRELLQVLEVTNEVPGTFGFVEAVTAFPCKQEHASLRDDRPQVEAIFEPSAAGLGRRVAATA